MSKTFTCTSSDPYLRHSYIIHSSQEKVEFDNWNDTFAYWRHFCHHREMIVEVVDACL